jgi:hypothetical protein
MPCVHTADLHRCPGESFKETVTWLQDLFQVDSRAATFLLWDKCFRVGTDRHYWVDERHARRYLDQLPPLPAPAAAGGDQ